MYRGCQDNIGQKHMWSCEITAEETKLRWEPRLSGLALDGKISECLTRGRGHTVYGQGLFSRIDAVVDLNIVLFRSRIMRALVSPF